MRCTHLAALAGIALALSSCASRAPISGPTGGAGTATPLVIPHGSGEFTMDGSVKYSRRFAVKGCFVNPPGGSVLSGYSMTILGGPAVVSGGILLRNYQHDGTYVIDAKDMPATLALYLRDTSEKPGGPVLTNGKGSSLSVLVANQGLSGKVEFKNWNGGKGHPGPISGTLTWRCALVRNT